MHAQFRIDGQALTTVDSASAGGELTQALGHRTAAARAEHEAMGFHEGWVRCADRLEAVARTL